jgi:hypothetical protein
MCFLKMKRGDFMKNAYLLGALALSMLAPSALPGTPEIITPATQTIGRNLETFTSIRLGEQAPAGGLEVTITSDDPTRLLVALTPDGAGSKSITLKVNAQYTGTPDFYLHALGDSGNVTYTASAEGFGSAKGTVTLAPSAILITGPSKSPVFRTTTGMQVKISLYSAMLDQEGKIVTQQAIAGGLKVSGSVKSSDPKAGGVTPSQFTIAGGDASGSLEFKPAGAGVTNLTIDNPDGFSTAAKMSSVAVTVELPGLGLTGEINLGLNLQASGVVLLGEAAPPKGVDITLTSEDPAKMVLSASEDKLGSKSITVHIPAGEYRAFYHIQGLADAGTVSYTGSAPGYRTRAAPVTLAPSGILVAYSAYGPPDEAEVLRKNLTRDPRPFTISLSEKPARITVWPAYLNPETKRGADITVQRLRPGVKATVVLKNSNPEVGKIASSVTLGEGAEFAETDFMPLSVGQTVISIEAPAGFTMPSNANAVTANVTK